MEERCDVPMRVWGNRKRLKQHFKERIKAFRQLCTRQEGSTMVPTVRATTARTLMEPLAAQMSQHMSRSFWPRWYKIAKHGSLGGHCRCLALPCQLFHYLLHLGGIEAFHESVWGFPTTKRGVGKILKNDAVFTVCRFAIQNNKFTASRRVSRSLKLDMCVKQLAVAVICYQAFRVSVNS